MLRHIKRSGCFIMLLTLAILLLSSNISFARFGAADIQGTWDITLRVKYTNVNHAGRPASSVFNDTATMKITQFVAGGGGAGSVVNVEIDGTTNPLIDGPTPTPDFYGEGVVTQAAVLGDGKDHMVAIHCPSNVGYAQQIIVHKIYRVTDMGFTRMKGTWVIVDNGVGDAEGIIATFTARRLDRDDPGVGACP